MSLIVDVLKRAQRSAVAKGAAPPFIKYPYEEGLSLRALISKYIWPFRLAIGFSMVIILAVFVMTLQGKKSTPTVDLSLKAITPSQEFSTASREPEYKQQKEGLNTLADQLGKILPKIGEERVQTGEHFMPLESGDQINLKADSLPLQKAPHQYPHLDLENYTVKSGDSLTWIVKERYGITKKDLYNEYLQLIKQLNPSLEDLDSIYPGQTLTLPIYSPQIASGPIRTTLSAPEPEYKPQKEKTQTMEPERKNTAPPAQEFSVASPQANLSEDKSTPGQREKTQAAEPEKKAAAPSPKGKEVRPENQFTPSGKILLEKRPSHDIRHHFDLAVSYQKLGEKAKALEQYRKVIEIDPMNVEAHNNLGVIYKDMGKMNLAVKEFQTVLSMNPRQEKAHNNLGIIFFLQGNLEKATQEFRGVLDINPRNREAYINLGVIYKRQNWIGKAKGMFENALSTDPYCPEAHYNLGLICEKSGDIKKAISHYQRFIDFSGSAYHELAAKVKRHLETLSQPES
jgi:Tfp pilus assembly protein PilF/LysM repeat protein